MSQNEEIKQGDLVTIQFGEYNTSSNVYIVFRKLPGECILNHPLFPECLIIKPDIELNRVPANMKSPNERCLEFLVKKKNYFDINEASKIDAICAYFIVKRTFSEAQVGSMWKRLGKASAHILGNNLDIAIKTVIENEALLDEQNLMWFQKMEWQYKKKKIAAPHQRVTIFNQAGFVLAQLETNSISKV